MPVDDPLYPVNLVLDGRRLPGRRRRHDRGPQGRGAAAPGAPCGWWRTEVGAEVRALGVAFEERPYRQRRPRRRVAGDRRHRRPGGQPRPCAPTATRARVWVNAADDPASCSFTLPAVVRQGPVTVTVSTAGHSPALATWLKGHVAAELGPEVAELAGLLSEAREQASQPPGAPPRTIDWRPALDWDMLDLIRTGRTWPEQGSACRRVCRRRRTQPPHGTPRRCSSR